MEFIPYVFQVMGLLLHLRPPSTSAWLAVVVCTRWCFAGANNGPLLRMYVCCGFPQQHHAAICLMRTSKC